MTYHGSCQCGAVTYEVDTEITGVMSCNCSRCHRLGWLLAFAPASDFRLLSGEENLIEYRFHKKNIAHLFCKTCGIQAFGRGTKPDGTHTVALNVRCISNIDLDALPVTKVNGKEF